MAVSALNLIQEPLPSLFRHKENLDFEIEDRNSQTASNPFESESQKNETYFQKAIHKLTDLAKVVDSRESVYRIALELLAFELPSLLAAATRNKFQFFEELFKGSIAIGISALAPNLAKFTTKIGSKLLLSPERHKDYKNYALFQNYELENLESLQKGLERIDSEEVKDQEFMAQLSDKEESKDHFLGRANEIKDFVRRFRANEDTIESLRKLKKFAVLGESLLEGLVWGTLPYLNRIFRKHILKQDSFTGTIGYTSEEQRKKIGDIGHYNLLQKLGALIAPFSGFLLNLVSMKLTENKEAVSKNKFLIWIKENQDFTRGFFPKLGLLLSYLVIPVNISRLSHSQGRNELIENILMLLTVAPSWSLGHRATNGIYAKLTDNAFSAKHQIPTGTFIETEDDKHIKFTGNKKSTWWDKLMEQMPEPARIQQVIRKTEGLPHLKKSAMKEHAKTLYTGFTLHSLLVFGVRILINHLTKKRVEKKLAA
jgi:hypothetical protein